MDPQPPKPATQSSFRRKTLRRLLILLCLALAGAVTALTLWPNRRALESWTPPVMRHDVNLELAELAAGLSDADLVGQLLVVGFNGRVVDAAVRERLAELRPAGVILFGRNVGPPEQVAGLTAELQALAAELGLSGLLVAIDQEGGRVRRLRNGFTPIPAMGEVPGRASLDGARLLGSLIGSELAATGCNWNLAPVVDVLTNPDNPGIGDRAFSGDSTVVSRYAAALAEGLNSAGVAICAKHFPGKGEAALDSHYDLPVIRLGRPRLESVEWPPFVALLDGNHPARTAMVSHVVIPVLDPVLPASLSPAVYRVLREEIGFDGVIVTDDLEMGGIVNDYEVGEAALLSVIAGADLVLICHDGRRMTEARETLSAALDSGRLDREELVRRVVRIWRLKLALGLELPGLTDYAAARDDLYTRRGLEPPGDNPQPTPEDCGSPAHLLLLRQALGE